MSHSPRASVVGGLATAIGLGLAVLSGPAHAADPRDLISTSANDDGAAVDHTTWDRLLETYVKPGADGLNRVDYASFKANGHDALNDYIGALEAIDPQTLSRPEQFALLANLYNAKTIDIVLDHYPVKSIKDISLGGGVLSVFTSGPWKAKVTKLNGVELSLDDIEHGMLRPVFKEPRIHYAVNCASVGCPNLLTEAFTGAKLEEQLDAAARAYVNHPRGVSVGPDGVVVSSIYKWYGDDFGEGETGVLEHIKTYASPELAAKLKGVNSISGYGYDWALNDAKQ